MDTPTTGTHNSHPTTERSWWMATTRSEFYAEIAERFKVNKAEPTWADRGKGKSSAALGMWRQTV